MVLADEWCWANRSASEKVEKDWKQTSNDETWVKAENDPQRSGILLELADTISCTNLVLIGDLFPFSRPLKIIISSWKPRHQCIAL